ncbi:MAG: DUF4139 domain-containing protein [Acidobacteriia bacterium]|nr:DUF4139 domain-containing protein [Terriglobia bacterium]
MRLHLVVGLSLVAVGAASAGSPPEVVSQAGQGRTLSLTVYNVGRALVRDGRPISLPGGALTLEFRDIAEHVMPETVSIAGDGVTVLEQNYEYDLLSPQTLLAKYLGRDVTLVTEEPGSTPGATVRKELVGRLLSIENGTVWRIGDRIVSNPPYRQLVFGELPENLRERPTLVWLLSSERAGERRLEATYLTSGITWKADYVLTLGSGGDVGSLLGWVTLDNTSGASYPEATLQLVAGDVHLAPAGRPGPQPVMMAARAVSAEMREEAFAEYHLYTLDRPTTVKDRQQKQVALLEADGVKAVRHYVVESPQWWYVQRISKQKQDVRVDVEITNRADNHLGMALPAGVVRLYQRDRRGTAQFVGEDRIEHTPKDELVKVTMGNAFDVIAERRQTDYRKLSDNLYEDAFEVTVRNHKESAVTVEVREQLGGDWEMLSNSYPFEKLSAFGVSFSVPVPANGEAKLTYRVRVHS